ncbi:MAG: hypothetical protein U0T31_01625 [Chitinophagales bacterium]
MKLRRKTIFFLFGLITTISACDKLKFKSSCGEFYVKNELSSAVFLRNYKLIDSGYYFSLDSFTIAPNETRKINEDCRSIDSFMPYPKGAFTKIFFASGISKTDTFSSSGALYLHDSINIYNIAKWTIEGDNKLRKATYTITKMDSLEAR